MKSALQPQQPAPSTGPTIPVPPPAPQPNHIHPAPPRLPSAPPVSRPVSVSVPQTIGKGWLVVLMVILAMVMIGVGGVGLWISRDPSKQTGDPVVSEPMATIRSIAAPTRFVATSSPFSPSPMNEPVTSLSPTYIGHSDAVYSVAWSPDGETLVSASADHTVQLWRVKDGQLLRTLEGHTDNVRSRDGSPRHQTMERCDCGG